MAGLASRHAGDQLERQGRSPRAAEVVTKQKRLRRPWSGALWNGLRCAGRPQVGLSYRGPRLSGGVVLSRAIGGGGRELGPEVRKKGGGAQLRPGSASQSVVAGQRRCQSQPALDAMEPNEKVRGRPDRARPGPLRASLCLTLCHVCAGVPPTSSSVRPVPARMSGGTPLRSPGPSLS